MSDRSDQDLADENRADQNLADRNAGQGGDGEQVSPTPEKDPENWVTGDEPMTGPQRSYLHTLAQEAGQEVPDGLSKVDASKLIDELQERTGRGN